MQNRKIYKQLNKVYASEVMYRHRVVTKCFVNIMLTKQENNRVKVNTVYSSMSKSYIGLRNYLT